MPAGGHPVRDGGQPAFRPFQRTVSNFPISFLAAGQGAVGIAERDQPFACRRSWEGGTGAAGEGPGLGPDRPDHGRQDEGPGKEQDCCYDDLVGTRHFAHFSLSSAGGTGGWGA
jgi:hypothetical protein